MIIGMYLRHIKAYKGINYIPIGYEYSFNSYIGENGVGKSSVLEGLNSFFNNVPYPINKSALADGITTKNNEPFIAGIFLIEKEKVKRLKKEFEKLSNFFWTVDIKKVSSRIQNSMKDFFELRESLEKKGYLKEDYYLIIAGEILISQSSFLSFASFTGEEKFLLDFLDKNEDELSCLSADEKKITIDKWREEQQKILGQKKWKELFIVG